MQEGIQMKRLIFLFAIMAVIGFGCSRQPSPSQVPQEGITLRFENWEVTPEQLKLWQEVVDKFNQTHPGIKVKFQPVQGGSEKILIEMAGGSAPDVFFWCAPTILTPLVEKKSVLSLASFIKEDGINPEDYFSSAWQASCYGEGMYGLPCYWAVTAIAYNKDLFDKVDISYPEENWTWDDFLAIAQKLTITKDGRIVQYGCTPPRNIVTCFGASFFNKKQEITIDTPEVKNAFQFLQDLRYEHKVSPSMAQLPPDSYRGEIEFFMTGRVAMFAVESWVLSVLKKIKDFSWDIAPMPRVKGKKRKIEEGNGCLCIATQTEHPKQSWEFIKFACGPEGQEILGRGGNNIPSLKKSADVFFVPPPEHIKTFINQIQDVAFSPGRFPWYREWEMTVLRSELDKLVLNKQTPEETIKNLVAKTKNFLSKDK